MFLDGEKNMALIFIVEDDENIREIEELTLRNVGYHTTGFGNAKDFFKRIDSVLPDLIILDIMLPDEDGNEIIKKIRNHPNTRSIPVIMVTAKTGELDLIKGLDNGADDYIKKPFSIMELVSRVRALLRRTKPDERMFILDDLVLNDDKHEVTLNNDVIELTFKEYELLRYFLLNRNIVLTREQIMEKVWGTDYEGESRTLDMHIKTLRKKLKEYGSRICTIRNVGYVLK